MPHMQAAIHTRYGGPEVVTLQQVAIPEPGFHEIRIKVEATTVNRTDCGFRSAEYFISRFFSGLWRPKQQTLGCEFAGVVDVVGRGVTTFAPGDKVLGFNDQLFGGHAQYMVLPEQAAVVPKPENLTWEEAAALTEGAHYALCNIRAAGVQAGQMVLVYGATGAIGSAAIQLCKQLGAHVVAVGPGQHQAVIASLGPDEIIDYQTEDYRKLPHRFHFVFDAVGKISFNQCKHLLQPRGIYISTELGKGSINVWQAIGHSLSKGRRVLFPLPATRREDMAYLAELAATGAFKPLIDRSYPLSQIVEAYQYVETRQKLGNVVVLPWA